MFSIIRDLAYLAHEAAYVPVRLVQALAEGLALGWETTRPSGDEGVTITHGPAWLADAEAEREVWEMNELHHIRRKPSFYRTRCGHTG